MSVCFGMRHVLAEFNNSFFEENKILIFCIIYLLIILLFIHIYYNSKISENIHISDINKLSNIELIKIIQKVGGEMILCPPACPPALSDAHGNFIVLFIAL